MKTSTARERSSDKARTLLIVAAGMVFAGCHHDGLPPGGDMPLRDMPMADMAVADMTVSRLVTYTQFLMDFARVQCMQLLACGQLTAANMAACIENQTVFSSVDYDVEIVLGHVELDELDCLNATTASRCDGSDRGVIDDACARHLFIAHQATGASCLSFAECATGYCKHTTGDAGLQPGGCMGTCAPFAAINDPCTLAEDNMCNNNVAFCSGGRCTALSSVGQGCSASPLLPCKPGLYCALSGVSGTCRAPSGQGAAGDACDAFQGLSTTTPSCAVGLFCKLPNMSTYQGICTAKKALGATCDAFDGYFGNPCVDGLICEGSPASTCQRYVAENGDCSGGKACEQMLYCDSTNKCVKLKADGASCTVGTYQCVAPAYLGGDSCLHQGDAAAGQGTCMPFRKPNDPCMPVVEDQTCSTGYCSPSTSRCMMSCQ